MASESNAMKRYAVAAVAAVNSTAAATETWYLAAAGALLVLVSWGMDAQYLTLERQYRGLYDKVREPMRGAKLLILGNGRVGKTQM